MDRRNIVITGFMGTGKTHAGRLVARRLGREFVDMDERIAGRAGLSIRELFATYGEPHFRGLESELCAELAGQDGLVIATGGGTLVPEENRALFASACVVCLDAAPDEILSRLEGQHDRPLLAGERPARVAELLEARRAAYGSIPDHVETTGCTPEAVADAIIAAFRATSGDEAAKLQAGSDGGLMRLEMRAGGFSCPVWLGEGLLDRLGEIAKHEKYASRSVVVTNPTVGRLYAERAQRALRAAGLDPVVVEMPDGEQYKTLETLSGLYDAFVGARLERRSPIFALGGGVVGDVAGLAAATFLRGLPLIQVPTTLLAMVDASLGGKVAVDHRSGKNLIGAFKFPDAVVADPGVLATLPREEYTAGMAETIKHAVIGDAGLLDLLDDGPLSPALLARAMQVKLDLVERDPFEENVRAYLNLGHTFGHALETLSGYHLRHGHAVAVGIAIAARLSANLRLCSEETRDRILASLLRHGLPVAVPQEFESQQVLAAMRVDKKVREGHLRLVLPAAIGHVEIVGDVKDADILAALAESRRVKEA